MGGLSPVWSGSVLRVQRNGSTNNHWMWSRKSWVPGIVGALLFQGQVHMSPPGEVFPDCPSRLKHSLLCAPLSGYLALGTLPLQLVLLTLHSRGCVCVYVPPWLIYLHCSKFWNYLQHKTHPLHIVFFNCFFWANTFLRFIHMKHLALVHSF